MTRRRSDGMARMRGEDAAGSEGKEGTMEPDHNHHGQTAPRETAGATAGGGTPMEPNHNLTSRQITAILFRKEMLDVFRDKKAIIMMILIPLLLYPLIFIGTLMVMSAVQSNMQSADYTVALACDDGGALAAAIDAHNEAQEGDAVPSAAASASASPGATASAASSDSATTDHLTVTDRAYADDAALQQAVQDESIDAYVTCAAAGGRTAYTITYVSSITNSSYAATILDDVLTDLRQEKVRDSITQAGLDADVIMNPITIGHDNIATNEQSIGSVLGMLIPFLLIVSLITGTMYPAIDTMAGEKERGTLETLLTLPVTNRQIIVSKFLTVAVVGVISALLNVISIAFMAWYMVRIMGQTMEAQGMSFDGIDIGAFAPAIVVTALAVIAFALFISAVTMCITAFAKSYKEANNYITPLMVVVMLAGCIEMIPNVELDGGMAFVPVANICLMIRDLMSFKVDYGLIAIVLLSNVAYAALAVWVLSRIYDSESVLFDEGRSGVQVFTRRSNLTAGGAPTSGDAWFIVVLVMFVYIFLGSALQLRFGLGGVFGIQMIILLVPLLYAIYTKKSLAKTYSFHRTSPWNFLAALFLAAGAILLGMIITSIVAAVFPEETSEVSQELTETLLGGSTFWLTFLVAALTPAVCEEMMFRGFVFSGFRSKYKTATAIALVAVIFGVYHMSITRFFTTAFLGAVLALTVYYAGSIFPAMMIHLINNTLAVVQMYYPEALERMFPALAADTLSGGAIAVICVAGAASLAVGIWMLVAVRRRAAGRDGGPAESSEATTEATAAEAPGAPGAAA